MKYLLPLTLLLPAALFAEDESSLRATTPAEVKWERLKLDEVFRSEGVAVADVNHDGKLDVLAGDVWYAAPDWKMSEIRTPGKFVAGVGYSNSFVNFAWDINGDGWEDMILIGFPGDPFHWYENPQNKPGHWQEHLIWHSACNESPEFEDIDGDGKPELVLGSQPESQIGFLTLPAKENAGRKWDFHAVSEPGDPMKNGTFKYYHGIGVGDVNQDGRQDVTIPHGWWEAPEKRDSQVWIWHPWTLSKDGKGEPLKGANMYVEDLDLDGDTDVMMTSAHDYGMWWFEQKAGEQGVEYVYHLIDESHSQTHALEFADINGDGQKDLVTGKRFFAHNGADPGAYEPVLMYWYEIKKTKGQPPQFLKHVINEGKDTGVGTQFLVRDMNGDGHLDIVLSNKKGVNILLQSR